MQHHDQNSSLFSLNDLLPLPAQACVGLETSGGGDGELNKGCFFPAFPALPAPALLPRIGAPSGSTNVRGGQLCQGKMAYLSIPLTPVIWCPLGMGGSSDSFLLGNFRIPWGQPRLPPLGEAHCLFLGVGLLTWVGKSLVRVPFKITTDSFPPPPPVHAWSQNTLTPHSWKRSFPSPASCVWRVHGRLCL